MKQSSEIDKRVENTLDSLEGVQRATPQPWLFARVKGKLLRDQEEERTIWGAAGSFLSKPVVAIAGLFLILFLNGVFLYNQDRMDPVVTAEDVQPNDSESLIASSSSFDFENLVQP